MSLSFLFSFSLIGCLKLFYAIHFIPILKTERASGDGNNLWQQERTQAFVILIEFYQKALEVFVPHADTEMTNPVSISRQFICATVRLSALAVGI